MILFHFVAGGWVGAEIGNTIERFDPDENKWEVVGSMAVSESAGNKERLCSILDGV